MARFFFGDVGADEYDEFIRVITAHRLARISTTAAIRKSVRLLANQHYLLSVFRTYLPHGFVIGYARNNVTLTLPNGRLLTYSTTVGQRRHRSRSATP